MIDFIGDIVWRGIFGSIGFGVLGLCSAILLLFILKAKGLLKRKRGISKFLVITYWIFIPIIFGFAFTALKGIYYAETKCEELGNNAIERFEEATYPSFHKYVTENIEKYTGNSILPSNEEIANKFVDESTDGGFFTALIIEWFLDFAEEEAVKKIADETDLTKESVSAIRLIQTNSIDGIYHGAFSRLKGALNVWISGFFRVYYLIVFAYWLVLMIFPITEIIIAYRRRKKLPIDQIQDL